MSKKNMTRSEKIKYIADYIYRNSYQFSASQAVTYMHEMCCGAKRRQDNLKETLSGVSEFFYTQLCSYSRASAIEVTNKIEEIVFEKFAEATKDINAYHKTKEEVINKFMPPDVRHTAEESNLNVAKKKSFSGMYEAAYITGQFSRISKMVLRDGTADDIRDLFTSDPAKPFPKHIAQLLHDQYYGKENIPEINCHEPNGQSVSDVYDLRAAIYRIQNFSNLDEQQKDSLYIEIMKDKELRSTLGHSDKITLIKPDIFLCTKDSKLEVYSKICPADIGEIISVFCNTNNITEINRLPDKLTEFTIPASITSITEQTFMNCKEIVDISIESGCHLENISENAIPPHTELYKSKFAELTNNKTDAIYMEDYLLKAADESGKIQIKDGTTTVSSQAFPDCSHTTEVIIPDSVINIESKAFDNFPVLTKIRAPAQIFQQLVKSVPNLAHNLHSITISGRDKNIENKEFENCSNLTDVTISDGVANIGAYTFRNCKALKNIKIADSVTYVGYHAFEGCRNVKELQAPLYLMKRLKSAHLLKSVENIVITRGATSIGSLTFSSCKRLKNINIPDKIVTIGSAAFRDCINLKNINIPASVAFIEQVAFIGCKSLSSVTFDKNSRLTIIGDWAFAHCKNLKNIVIPNSVIAIGHNAFLGCNKLKEIHAPAHLVEQLKEEYPNINIVPNEPEVSVDSELAVTSIHGQVKAIKTNAETPDVSDNHNTYDTRSDAPGEDR